MCAAHFTMTIWYVSPFVARQFTALQSLTQSYAGQLTPCVQRKTVPFTDTFFDVARES